MDGDCYLASALRRRLHGSGRSYYAHYAPARLHWALAFFLRRRYHAACMLRLRGDERQFNNLRAPRELPECSFACW
jgi:hypothetical protein